MTYKKVQLCPDKPWVTLEYFGNELNGGPRDAMLVIPGGGYWCVCSDREGYPIAMAYYLQGMQSFVLTYSTNKQIDHYTQPLEEATLAMLYIRQHAEELGVGERVFTVGFSAGGHLAGWLSTCWDLPCLRALFPDKGRLNRPDGVVLCYAVTGEFREKVKETSFNMLYCRKEELTKEELDEVVLYDKVNADSSPAFIVHTSDDQRVPIENALNMAEAYVKAGMPFEMHVYPHGPHGMALGNDVTWCGNSAYDCGQYSRWVADSRAWMKGLE